MTRHFAIIGCLAALGIAALQATTVHAQANPKTLRVGVQLLPQTQGAPFSALNLPVSMPHQAIFDTLTTIASDGSVQPGLAVKWVAETPTRWVITLREGVKFSNGEALTADSIVTGIEYLLTPKGRSESVGSQINTYGVIAAKARDALTVEIDINRPDAILPLHLMFFRAVAPEAWRKLGAEGYAAAPIGTGPFKVARWAAGKIEMDANPTSWRAPKLDKLEILQIAEPTARVQALTSGAIDVAFGISPDEREGIEAVGGKLITYRTPETSFLAFVTVKESPVKDVRVRQALNYAVNKQRIIDTIMHGATTPSSQITHPLGFGYNPDLKPYAYDPAKAKALLAEAGYPNGFALPALMVGNANSDDTVYQQIATDLAAVGVKMELRRITFAKNQEYVYQGGWPSLAFSMRANGYDPLNAYRIRSCGWVHPYHCDPTIMPLIEAARDATTPEERRARTQKVMAHERDNPPGIILWQTPYFDGVAKRVTGYSATEEHIPFHSIDVQN
ncbi:MAG: ABC transporter substrate-binding protein [Rhodospirillaceae bacterium]|nr:ABC transporter substrate-binding protein [Rhodospirillaceae bacterium]